MRSLLFEHDLSLGVRLVAGADEAGRGCLAGPLVAAAVSFDVPALAREATDPLAAVHDSKKLTAARRAQLLPLILERACKVSVQVVPVELIDSDGVHVCNLRALADALTDVGDADVMLVDHYQLPEGSPPHRSITKGDATSLAIAAASIVAKETRDQLMREAATLYPEYGFEQHAGYGTAQHLRAVEQHGPTPLHRMSFNASCYRVYAETRG